MPLAGRFVNHFWRLVEDLNIPYLTLLDFDKGRNTGGDDKIKYIIKQLELYENLTEDEKNILESPLASETDKLSFLEKKNVYFSYPLDIDFAMLKEFKDDYMLLPEELKGPNIPSIEGDNYETKNKEAVASVLKTDSDKVDIGNLPDNDISLYYWYRYLFLGRGKPVSHLNGLLNIEENGNVRIPSVYEPLLNKLKEMLKVEL